jgi:Tfp pilus assembly protein PilO
MLINDTIRSGPATKVIISVSFVAIVALAAYNWVISPQITYLHAAEQYKSIVEGAGAKSAVILKNVEKKLVELEKLQQDVSGLENNFFTFEKAREFFSDIEPVAVQHNCAVESSDFMLSVSKKSGDVSDVTLSRAKVTLSGNYKNIMKFLEKIRDYPQRIVISNLLIERSDKINNDLNCQVTITIYVIEDKEAMTHE